MNLRLIALAILGCCALWPSAAGADCTDPGGTASDQFYNNVVNAMQYCNGSVWVDMGSTIGVSTLTANDLCTTDGTNVICTVGNPLPASYGGTGVANSNTITLGGNVSTAGAFTISGAYGLTLTVTGTTSVTLPTSGTLETTALSSGDIWVGSGSNLAAAQALSGDCTLSNAGAITCTKTNGTSFGALATLGIGTGLVSGNGNLNLSVPVGVANGGTGANLSSTGGTSEVLQQASTGGAITVGQLSYGSLSNAATSCSVNATNASNITSGTLGTAEGGFGGNFSAANGALYITSGVVTAGTLAISNGGTGQTTAQAARGSSSTNTVQSLNIDEMTIPSSSGNTNYQILTTDRTVAVGTTALTAGRTWTLPLGSQVNAGQTVCIVDKAGGISSTDYLTIGGAGSDTVEPATAATIKTQYGSNCACPEPSHEEIGRFGHGVPAQDSGPALVRQSLQAWRMPADQGECPLTKGSDGVWRGPDGKAVDDKLAHMGDCKENAR